MSASEFKTPIIFIIFNRPDLTQVVFEVIRQIQPKQLFVVADGARSTKLGESELCQDTRAIIDQVDWSCEVHKNYADVNLGCRERVSSGISWAFEHVEEAIILEDDCVPDLSFFPFCQELLERYRYDTRIMAISGDNFQFGRVRSNYSYYFSRYPHCWGWATWRRAWQHYDHDMSLWPEIRDGGWLSNILENPYEDRYRQAIFQKVYEKRIDTWDYCWGFSCWIQNGLTILPKYNLVRNIGFSESGTHTKSNRHRFANMITESIEFPLRHPSFLIRNIDADRYTWETMYSFRSRLLRKVREILKL